MANLAEIVICLKEDLGSEDFNELCEAVNNVIQDSNVLNCVFDPDEPEFTDLLIGTEFIELEVSAQYLNHPTPVAEVRTGTRHHATLRRQRESIYHRVAPLF